MVISMVNKTEETADLLVLTERATSANTRNGTLAARRITSAVGRIYAIEGNFEKLTALEAEIKTLKATVAVIEDLFTGDARADYIRVKVLSAEQITSDRLFVDGSAATWKDPDSVSKVIGR